MNPSLTMLITQIKMGDFGENIQRGPGKRGVINLECISIDSAGPVSVWSVPQTDLPVPSIIIAPHQQLGSCRDHSYPAITYIET